MASYLPDSSVCIYAYSNISYKILNLTILYSKPCINYPIVVLPYQFLVARLLQSAVLQATNAGVRRPGYEASESSLQCLISTNCISLDRALQALQAVYAGILVSGKNWIHVLQISHGQKLVYD